LNRNINTTRNIPRASNFFTIFSSTKSILQLIHLLEVAADARKRQKRGPMRSGPDFLARPGGPGNCNNPQLKRFCPIRRLKRFAA
jgi:hypothetical protein